MAGPTHGTDERIFWRARCRGCGVDCRAAVARVCVPCSHATWERWRSVRVGWSTEHDGYRYTTISEALAEVWREEGRTVRVVRRLVRA